MIERKKLGIIMVCIAAALGLVLIVVAAFVGTDEPQETEIVNVFAEHPDADLDAVSDSKLNSYQKGRRSNVEDYWDQMNELEGDSEDDDPMSDLSKEKAAPVSASSQLVNTGKLFKDDDNERTVRNSSQGGGGTSSSPERVSSQTSGQKPIHMMTEEERMAYVSEIQRQNVEQTLNLLEQYQDRTGQTQQHEGSKEESGEVNNVMEEEETSDRIVSEKAFVRRSGGISSLDDSYGNGGGITSLDDPYGDVFIDAHQPFKCMFVKEQKIETGQRVSIRLLEDMVIAGTLVPRNTHLMAVCTLGERLDLKVTSIEMNGRLYSMNCVAYDTDGGRGIYCPDIDDTAKREMTRGGLGLTRRSTSLMGALANDVANIGLAIAETATQNNKRSVKVPSGYVFYLVNMGKDN